MHRQIMEITASKNSWRRWYVSTLVTSTGFSVVPTYLEVAFESRGCFHKQERCGKESGKLHDYCSSRIPGHETELGDEIEDGIGGESK